MARINHLIIEGDDTHALIVDTVTGEEIAFDSLMLPNVICAWLYFQDQYQWLANPGAPMIDDLADRLARRRLPADGALRWVDLPQSTRDHLTTLARPWAVAVLGGKP